MRRKQRRAVVLNRNRPRFRGLGRIRRTHHVQAWNRAQSGDLLDGLVRWTILAHAYAVVREHVKRLQLAQRAQPDRRLHVIGEHQECRAERKHAAVRRHAVHRRSHGVLANTERNVAPRVSPHSADRALARRSTEFRRLKIAHHLSEQCSSTGSNRPTRP